MLRLLSLDVTDFGGQSMASGYARWRPPVHPIVVEAARAHTGERAVGLDVGCGAGSSTRALQRIAFTVIGVDPLESMIRGATEGNYVVAQAEYLPVKDASVDIISAAGSLNYVVFDRFFPEALRVLTTDGLLLVYDFSPGRSFRDDESLDRWYQEFATRYPPPVGAAQPLDPDILRNVAAGFQVLHADTFEYSLDLTPEFYLEYMLTETSVSHAVRHGTSLDSIRAWCVETLSQFFEDPREVLFRGYSVILARA